MSRDFQFTTVVSLSKIYELKPTKGMRRTYVLIENNSGSPIKFDHSVSPNDFNGSVLATGGKYERENNAPQTTIFIKGTTAADQNITVGQGYQ